MLGLRDGRCRRTGQPGRGAEADRAGLDHAAGHHLSALVIALVEVLAGGDIPVGEARVDRTDARDLRKGSADDLPGRLPGLDPTGRVDPNTGSQDDKSDNRRQAIMALS